MNFSQDEILRGKLILKQAFDSPRVNLDTILLAAWVKIHSNNSHFLEIGCASGAISLILAMKFGGKFRITGLDIQQELVNLANQNLEANANSENNLSERVKFFHGDIRDRNIFMNTCFDAIVINPPYETIARSRTSKHESVTTARIDSTCSPVDIADAASRLLKSRGRLFTVFNAARLPEFVQAMTSRRIILKRLRFVHPKLDRNANIFLAEFIKDAGDGVIILPPLFVYGADGKYTPEVLDAYKLDGAI